MTDIPHLPAATAAGSTDMLPISQSGVTRAASVAQITAGLQPTLALNSGQLLGRISAGTGAPENVTIGANLSLAGGTLAATAAPYNVSSQSPGTSPSTSDLVAMSQAGSNTAVSFGTFMSGLPRQAGLDISQLATTPAGTILSRRLSAQMADALPVEAFGAVGDGLTDDTGAFAIAFASGHPVRLGSKTYVVNGQLTISAAAANLIGVPGQSILRRLQQTNGSSWISIQGTSFRADGVTFDANGGAIATDNWAVLVTAACLQTDFHRCLFLNAGGATLGHGITFLASDPAQTQHSLRGCEFANNAVHGLWVQACAGALIEACHAHNNGSYGIVLDFNDPTFVQKQRLAQVIGCRAWNNQRGIVVGNYNATNTNPAVWGNANPDAISAIVACNVCHDNSVYGIAISGSSLLAHSNLCSNNGNATVGAGILANISYSRLTANMITGSAAYGIDSGGSINAEISQNHILNHGVGINCGGSVNVRVDGNTLQGAAYWAIQVNNVETDGRGNNFGLVCSQLALTDNWIAMTSAAAGGILLRDGPSGILVARNNFVGSGGASLANALWASTDQIIIEQNRWNFTQRFYVNPTALGGLQTLIVPDIADSLMVTSAATGIQSMLTNYQTIINGQISFIRVTAGGSGYTSASIALSGTGTGATANAVINNGVIIGVVVTAGGSGYGSNGATVTVVISGNGTGATAIGYAGVPIPEERRLLIRCNTAVKFFRASALPVQENWKAADMTVAANADVLFVGTFNSWRTSYFSSADYMLPDTTGGTQFRSFNNGDVQLRPNGSGHVRLTSDAEATGCSEMIGRNTPQGAVAAPPGSTYRNLNGGIGSSFFVKQTGTGNTGWSAIA